MSVLRAEGLAFSLPDTRAIFTQVDLALEPGAIVSLVGPSGTGKSSLLRVLAGLAPASAGRVLLHGAPLTRPVRNVALAFQSATLLPWLSVEDNVALGLSFERPALSRAQRRARAQEALAEVGLTAARALRPGQLSGGMAQRAALARCLVRRPEVLLLDEPFSALDEITRGQLHALLERIVRVHDTATLLVTHAIDEALSWMPIAVMAFGIGDRPIHFLLAFAAVWPIVLSTAAGVRQLDPSWLELGRSLSASRWQLLWHFIVPGVLGHVLTGVRLAIGICWIVLVPCEMLGVSEGLGYAILDTRDRLAYSELMALVLLIGALGLALDALARWSSRRWVPAG